MNDEASFGHWLKQRREALDLTRDELARLVGCALETIRKIERDQRRPSKQVAERLVAALSIPPAERIVFIDLARGSFSLSASHVAPDSRTTHPQSSPRGFLPAPLTPLIGREEELKILRSYVIRSDARLVTITGAPGIGKTRLALQVVSEAAEAFADGVVFVSLANVDDPSGVAPAIAQTLGIQGRPGQSMLDSLHVYLRGRQMLLALDNFEHLLAAAMMVADLLSAAPRIKALVTSRAALRVSGEHEFPVQPLALPDLDRHPPIEELIKVSAVQLFAHRARAVRAEFTVTDENAPAICAICHRLDGLPLAIELAAARVKLFSPQALLARLEHRLQLLTDGARDLPARQQTLRSTIDWSYQLLDESEKVLFARLGVFVGGCTLEAAEAVCNAEGDLIIDVVDAIAALIGKSLLQREERIIGEPRLTMLETIREYALERLAMRSEVEVLRQWHANYYLTLVEQSERAFRGPQARRSMDRIEVEYGNVCATLIWSQAGPGRAALGLRLAGALLWFWDQRSWAEGAKWLARVLHRAEANAKTVVRAKALIAASFFAYGQNDLGNALVLAQEALALARELGDQRSIAWALLQMGDLSKNPMRDIPENLTVLEESLALFRAIDEKFGIARTLFVLGYAKFRQGDGSDSIVLLEESRILFRELGDKSGAADPSWALGLVALERGEVVRAVALFEESLALYQDAGDRWGVANALGLLGIAESQRGSLERAVVLLAQSAARWRDQEARSSVALTLNCMGDVAQRRGDYAGAAAYYDESLALYQELDAIHEVAMVRWNQGHLAHQQHDSAQAAALLAQDLILCRDNAFQDGIAYCLLGLGWVAMAQAHPREATRLFSTAVQQLPSRAARLIGAAYLAPLQIASNLREPFDRLEFESNLAALRAQLGDATFAATWDEGRAMTLDQSIAYAIESTELAAQHLST